MAKINYYPKLLDEKEIIQKIEKELDEKRSINALLLAYGYIEAYLLEIIIYSGRIQWTELKQKIIENIQRINFNTLLHINLVLGNISYELYTRILEFNKKRNKIVHELISLDLNSKKTKKMINRQVKNAIEICKILADIHRNKIKERAKELEKHRT